MKGKRNRSCVVLLCLCLASPIAAKAEEFSDVFVFSDSLSDTGNLAVFVDAQAFFLTRDPKFLTPTERVALCFPGVIFNPDGTVEVDPDFPCDDLFFMNSRVSNGPVAVEVLAERLGFDDLQPSLHPLSLLGLPRPFVGTNYAVAGAHARVRIDPETGMPEPEDLGTQIFAFRLDHGGMAPPGALYVVMIGGNDSIDAAQALLDPSEDPRAIIDAAVNAIGDNINLLIDEGARKFLVANSPNIGSIPAIKIAAEEAGVPPVLLRGLATLVTIEFNRQLAERLGQIQADQPLVEIKQFNLFRFFEGVRFLGKLFGVFENIKDPCFDSGEYRDTGARNFDPDCGVDKFDDFVFFDDLHPTGQVHRIVGKALSRAARKLIND